VGIDASGYAMAADTPHPQEAWALIEFLAGRHASESFAASGLIVPARGDVARSTVFLAPDQLPKNSQAFIDVIAEGVPTHTPPRWNEIAEVLGLALDPVWDGKTTPEAALQTLGPAIEKLLPQEEAPSAEVPR
jgi:multiple sugar transport system substrate-binding protein